MRFPPAHAAPRDTAPPPKRRIPRSLRTALSVAVAGVFGLVPAVMVATPAQAVPNDFLTIADAGNYEGQEVKFTLTYTGTVAATFTITADDGLAPVSPLAEAGADFSGPPVVDEGAGTDFLDGTELVSPYFDAGVQEITFPISSAAAPSTATVSVVTGDDPDEVDETFILQADLAGGPAVTATGTIWALPSPIPTFELIAPATAPESQSTVTVTATLSATQDHDVTIPVSTIAGTSPAAVSTGGTNRDYTALPTTAKIVVLAGQLSGTIDVSLWDDSVYEGDNQNFQVTSGTALGASGASTTADIGIVDNDAVPTVSIGNAPGVLEGANLVFPITLSSLSEGPLTVQFTASNGTDTATTHGATGSVQVAGGGGVLATTNNDFLRVPRLADAPVAGATVTDTGVVTIPAYNKTVNKLVKTNTDAFVEGAETVNATLTAIVGGTGVPLGTPTTAIGTITDNATGPTVDYEVPTSDLNGTTFNADDLLDTFIEGNTGERATYINLTVNASGTQQVPLQLNYSFTDVTATNGVDYRGTSGSFTIPVSASTTALQIPITLIGDKIYEYPDETFKVVLTSPNGTIDPDSLGATVFTIKDMVDDLQPTWTTGNISVVEGNSGTTMARVPIKLTGPTNVDVTFTAASTGTPSATDGGVNSGTTVGADDFDLPTVKTVTVPIGSTTAYFDVPINGDVVFEHDESFTVTFTPPASTIVDSTPSTDRLSAALVTVTNDDAAPTVSFNQLASTEGSTIKVTGTTAGLSQYQYKLDFAVAATGTNPATATTDYEVLPNPLLSATVPRGTQGALLIGPAPTTADTMIAEIYLSPDDIDEATETFGVTATETTPAPTGVATTTGTYRISDDPADLPPTASVSDETIKEHEGSVDVTVSLAFTGETTSSTQDFSLSYYTVDGSAVEPEDYTETRGTLTIPAGTLSKKINVPIKNDNRAEPAQDFFVKIGTPGPTGATVGKSSGEVMIGASTGTTDPTDPGTDAPTLKSLASFRLGAGKASLSGKAGAGATVELWGRNADSDEDDYAKITQTTASSSGAFAFQPAMTTHGMYFMAKANSLSSAAVKVSIREDPDIAATSTGRRTVKLTVTGDPKIRGLEARVFRVNAGGRLTLVGSGRLNATGTFTKTLTGLASGRSYTYKSYVVGIGSRGILTGFSSYSRTVRVR